MYAVSKVGEKTFFSFLDQRISENNSAVIFSGYTMTSDCEFDGKLLIRFALLV